jgi:acetyl/propionyl-CoA carboxylase alpha subunit
VKRLVVANRGEIARRVLRAARERGMTVAVVSTAADTRALVRREAEVLEVASFLDVQGIVSAARRWRAELLHPGYGYLSESPAFAAAVEGAGIRFVGPSAENMRALGGKESARALAASLSVSTLPALGSTELAGLDPADWPAALAARGIAPPYLVKAAGGGGGRGMRLVSEARDLRAAVASASEEAQAAFSDGTVFVERFLETPRHVEIQVFGDGEGGGVFWGERECSLQRRHQKVFEEAPSSAVDPQLREALGRAALSLVQAARYRGAGTVEFLLDPGGRFFFLEVNTRLQVEHPVTEMVYGIDLVQAQLDLAEGRWPETFPSPRSFAVPTPRGQAFEARVLAEDPERGFLPAPGLVRRYHEPAGAGVRVDSGIAVGSPVTTAFDSLVAKLIVHGKDRATALERMAGALEEYVIHGCGTNLGFLRNLVRHPDVRAGRFHTRWIDEHKGELLASHLPAGLQALVRSPQLADALAKALDGGTPRTADGPAEWLRRQPQVFPSFPGTSTVALRASGVDAHGRVRVSGSDVAKALAGGTAGGDGGAELLLTATRVSPDELALSASGETWSVREARAGPGQARARAAARSRVEAPLAGKVVEVRVVPGDEVEEGQALFVLESMKMQIEVASPLTGVVREVLVFQGQVLEGPDTLAILSTASGGEQEAS